MKKFLRENEFERISSRGNDRKKVYFNPSFNVFITIDENGEVKVGGMGAHTIKNVENMRRKLDEYMESKSKGR